jgi:cell division protein FtsQ
VKEQNQLPSLGMRWEARLRRWSVRLAVTAGFLVLLAGGCQLLAWSPMLSLKRVEVTTDGRLERREILQLGGVRPGESLLHTSPSEIRQRLEAHPWVERAWVERSFPNTLRIRVQERKPVARVVVEGKLFLVDASGSIFPAYDRPPPGEWITLVGLKLEDLDTRPEACRRVVLEAMALAGLLAQQARWSADEIAVDPDRGIRLALQGGPSEVLFGFGELAQRVRRLEKILEHLSKEGRLQDVVRIDLRHPGRATVKFRG